MRAPSGLKKSSGLPSSSGPGESKGLDEAGRQFEAVFLRQILSSLERATGTQNGGKAGSNLYGSMLVEAVADSVSRAGGIGLGAMLVHSLDSHVSALPNGHGPRLAITGSTHQGAAAPVAGEPALGPAIAPGIVLGAHQ
jgi:Rod binding domain-containing protein